MHSKLEKSPVIDPHIHVEPLDSHLQLCRQYDGHGGWCFELERQVQIIPPKRQNLKSQSYSINQSDTYLSNLVTR